MIMLNIYYLYWRGNKMINIKDSSFKGDLKIIKLPNSELKAAMFLKTKWKRVEGFLLKQYHCMLVNDEGNVIGFYTHGRRLFDKIDIDSLIFNPRYQIFECINEEVEDKWFLENAEIYLKGYKISSDDLAYVTFLKNLYSIGIKRIPDDICKIVDDTPFKDGNDIVEMYDIKLKLIELDKNNELYSNTEDYSMFPEQFENHIVTAGGASIHEHFKKTSINGLWYLGFGTEVNNMKLNDIKFIPPKIIEKFMSGYSISNYNKDTLYGLSTELLYRPNKAKKQYKEYVKLFSDIIKEDKHE
jgi:hypothetical protein